jgi:hypothetical protein
MSKKVLTFLSGHLAAKLPFALLALRNSAFFSISGVRPSITAHRRHAQRTFENRHYGQSASSSGARHDVASAWFPFGQLPASRSTEFVAGADPGGGVPTAGVWPAATAGATRAEDALYVLLHAGVTCSAVIIPSNASHIES